MKRAIIPLLLLAIASVASAQQNPAPSPSQGGPPIPQGSSLPAGLSAIPINLNGPGYLEFGGAHSNLTNGNPDWTDAYLRAFLSGGKNGWALEATRQSRYGDTGWFYSAGWTRTLSENWYTNFQAGTSSRCFFLPKWRVDGFINRKLLPKKQLVTSVGLGYDRYKTVQTAYRANLGGIYYFSKPFVLQGGVTFTHSNPGSILARSQYVALTQGHDKEHYIIGRAEFGREAYQLVGPATALFNFPVRDYTVTWRQWVGFNWGFNIVAEHYQNPYFSRTGGTVGFFLDF
jgi:YaiO family outer membrane protein